MPDLASRAARERDLSAAVLLILQQEQDRLLRSPQSADWPAFERRLRAAIITDLAATHFAAGVQLAAQAGIEVNNPRMEAESQRWAMRYAEELATAIAQNTRQSFAAAMQERDREALTVALLLLMGDERALSIGITETTRAITTGEGQVVRRFELETGRRVPVLWKTEGDSRVCPVCGPLESQPEEVFQRIAPAGPPAHPRCRCFLEWAFGAVRRAA